LCSHVTGGNAVRQCGFEMDVVRLRRGAEPSRELMGERSRILICKTKWITLSKSQRF
jgi:hypothetical protein